MEHAIDQLDGLAERLRERLLAEAGSEMGTSDERIRALVDREAGLLDAASRRVSRAAASVWGRSSR